MEAIGPDSPILAKPDEDVSVGRVSDDDLFVIAVCMSGHVDWNVVVLAPEERGIVRMARSCPSMLRAAA